MQVGQTTECEVSARYNLHGAYQVFVTGTGVAATVDPPKDVKGAKPMVSRLKVRFQVAADALPGVRDVRIATPQGASTVDVNAYFQQLLKGTPWQYYELVVTQWPFNFSQFTTKEQGGVYPQDAGGAFPVYGAVNTTMETYFQEQNDAAGAGGNSCMSCHYSADQTDFSWGLNRRAHN